ncbi:hypothetical protein A2415_02200 [candidate division WWE3 bacterium RIFOXYC1_FULL_39_7]|uniref:Uncharacterized protein n=2 Tax=Katanobacteria TaxID=422282 RepID=A0A1F4XAT1_UNCKA|nr:MAG: hypothetical protein A2415_02200 [candidate division WWE3 bacterium RIFOXYC1_FULL_39_7]OGC78173.1 MAG: hypothetical protein A2619_01790 [candidate division WWE3 bacterium RIFOXYD1_FULL_39_9]
MLEDFVDELHQLCVKYKLHVEITKQLDDGIVRMAVVELLGAPGEAVDLAGIINSGSLPESIADCTSVNLQVDLRQISGERVMATIKAAQAHRRFRDAVKEILESDEDPGLKDLLRRLPPGLEQLVMSRIARGFNIGERAEDDTPFLEIFGNLE